MTPPGAKMPAPRKERDEIDGNASFVRAWIESGAMLSLGGGRVLVGAGVPRLLGDAPAAASFFAPDFFLDDPCPFREYPDTRVASVADLTEALGRTALDAARATFGPPSRAAFDRDLAEIRELFRAGALLKAVPVVTRSARIAWTPGVRARVLRNALRRSETAPTFAYGTWDSHEGVIGATPELLVEVARDGSLRTMALAATRAEAEVGVRSSSLLEDPKEAEEHRIVVEAIRDDVSRFGDVRTGPTREVRLPGLTHLRTDIEVRTDRTPRLTDVVGALHPTPALGAYPKLPGLEWLRRADARSPKPRGRFGAPFGAVLGDLADADAPLASCVVAIRGVRWRGEDSFVAAGCGVVPQSDPDREWAETLAKLETVERLLYP